MPQLVQEWQWIVMTIRQEADGESINGKIAVAEVIRNRMRTGYQSDGTAVGTVMKPFQFSGWNTNDLNRIRIGKINIEDPLTAEAINAYNSAFIMNSQLVQGANLYHSILMSPFPDWSKGEHVKKINIIGRHIFYRDEK